MFVFDIYSKSKEMFAFGIDKGKHFVYSEKKLFAIFLYKLLL